MEPEHEVQTIKSTQNVHYIQVINLWVGLAQGIISFILCVFVSGWVFIYLRFFLFPFSFFFLPPCAINVNFHACTYTWHCLLVHKVQLPLPSLRTVERKITSTSLSVKRYTFLLFDDGIRQKICSRMLYGIAWGTRGWVFISSHDVGYDIPSLSARYCVAF